MKTHLVLSGGGIYGVYMLGCLDILLKENEFTHICGTSIGAVIGVLITFMEISDILEILQNHKVIEDIDIDINNLLLDFGIIKPDSFLKLLKKCFIRYLDNENPTFQDIYNKTKKEVFITGSNITKCKLDVFSCKNNATMSVLKAIEISISIPFVFTKVKYNGCIYVDGGVTNMYPSDVFENVKEEKLLCLYIVYPIETNDLNDPLGYINAIMSTILHSQKKIYRNIDTIRIDNNVSINLINYTKEDIKMMIEYGRTKAKQYQGITS